ncbi:unnamed protein product [Moneuplotes crassus]|uniref:Uncharacterized protein n=1 Tax=Euplotes crassus TaxID=5936 RepID=A0AAD1UIT9_EUPCR|nr:unnamed protein product [Moneuplotes crassus]
MAINEDSKIELPLGWISLEIGEVPMYYHPETKVFSVTAPFSLTNLEYTYKMYFDKPLVINCESIKEQVSEFLKGSPQSPVKRLISSPYKRKDNKLVKPCGDKECTDNDPDIVQRESLSQFARKDIKLEDIKIKVNDVVSLFIQTCESVLHFRPTIDFVEQKQKQRCIIKLKQELICQVTLVGKKKSKHIACDIAMKLTFPILYKQWLDTHPKIKEDLIKIADQHQKDYGGQKIYIGADTTALSSAPKEKLPPQHHQVGPRIENSKSNHPQNIQNLKQERSIKQEYIPEKEHYHSKKQTLRPPEPEHMTHEHRYQKSRPTYEKRMPHGYKRKREDDYSRKYRNPPLAPGITYSNENPDLPFLKDKQRMYNYTYNGAKSYHQGSHLPQEAINLQFQDKRIFMYPELLKNDTPFSILQKLITDDKQKEPDTYLNIEESSAGKICRMTCKYRRFTVDVAEKSSHDNMAKEYAAQAVLYRILAARLTWLELIETVHKCCNN